MRAGTGDKQTGSDSSKAHATPANGSPPARPAAPPESAAAAPQPHQPQPATPPLGQSGPAPTGYAPAMRHTSHTTVATADSRDEKSAQRPHAPGQWRENSRFAYPAENSRGTP